MAAIITREVQERFELTCNGVAPDNLPDICGYFGRACHQMNKDEGANRMTCIDCPLAHFALRTEVRQIGNCGETCSCGAYMYANIYEDKYVAICPQCGFSFEGELSPQ